MNRARRFLLFGLVGLGIAVLATSGLALKPAIMKRWYIWKLERGDEQERAIAAAELWRMGSAAAVPHKLRDIVVERSQHLTQGQNTLAVRFDGEPIAFETPCVIDFEYVHGHGAYLSFVRCRVHAESVGIERVRWNGRTLSRTDVSADVAIAQIARRDFARVLEAVRLLPRVVLRESKSGPAISTTNDFFALIRVLDEKERPVFQRDYCGYEEVAFQGNYLAILAVSDLAAEILDDVAHWKPVPTSQWRQSHFSSAFASNEKLMTRESCWFLMEDSVEALACFGNDRVIRVLASLGEQANTSERGRRKIEDILSRPAYWLGGEPKDHHP